jgi:hypothetical protein
MRNIIVNSSDSIHKFSKFYLVFTENATSYTIRAVRFVLSGSKPIKKVPLTDAKAQKGVEVQLYSYLTWALEVGERSAPRLGRFTPGKNPVPIVQEAGWAPGPVWTCAKNLAPTGIRSPNRPALSQSLYRLSYPGPRLKIYNGRKIQVLVTK